MKWLSIRTSNRGSIFWSRSCKQGSLLQLGDFRQQRRRFLFQRSFHRLIIGCGKLSGLVFKVKVAQVLVHGFLPLQKKRHSRLSRPKLKCSRQVKNVKQNSGGEQNAK